MRVSISFPTDLEKTLKILGLRSQHGYPGSFIQVFFVYKTQVSWGLTVAR